MLIAFPQLLDSIKSGSMSVYKYVKALYVGHYGPKLTVNNEYDMILAAVKSKSLLMLNTIISQLDFRVYHRNADLLLFEAFKSGGREITETVFAMVHSVEDMKQIYFAAGESPHEWAFELLRSFEHGTSASPSHFGTDGWYEEYMAGCAAGGHVGRFNGAFFKSIHDPNNPDDTTLARCFTAAIDYRQIGVFKKLLESTRKVHASQIRTVLDLCMHYDFPEALDIHSRHFDYQIPFTSRDLFNSPKVFNYFFKTSYHDILLELAVEYIGLEDKTRLPQIIALIEYMAKKEINVTVTHTILFQPILALGDPTGCNLLKSIYDPQFYNADEDISSSFLDGLEKAAEKSNWANVYWALDNIPTSLKRKHLIYFMKLLFTMGMTGHIKQILRRNPIGVGLDDTLLETAMQAGYDEGLQFFHGRTDISYAILSASLRAIIKRGDIQLLQYFQRCFPRMDITTYDVILTACDYEQTNMVLYLIRCGLKNDDVTTGYAITHKLDYLLDALLQRPLEISHITLASIIESFGHVTHLSPKKLPALLTSVHRKYDLSALLNKLPIKKLSRFTLSQIITHSAISEPQTAIDILKHNLDLTTFRYLAETINHQVAESSQTTKAKNNLLKAIGNRQNPVDLTEDAAEFDLETEGIDVPKSPKPTSPKRCFEIAFDLDDSCAELVVSDDEDDILIVDPSDDFTSERESEEEDEQRPSKKQKSSH